MQKRFLIDKIIALLLLPGTHAGVLQRTNFCRIANVAGSAAHRFPDRGDQAESFTRPGSLQQLRGRQK